MKPERVKMNGPSGEATWSEGLSQTLSSEYAADRELPLVMVDLAAARKQAAQGGAWVDEPSGLWWEQTEEGGLREVDAEVATADEMMVRNARLTGSRRERRLPVGRSIRIEVLRADGSEERWEADLADACTRGIGLVMRGSVEAGQRLCLRLQHERRRVALMYEVRHVHALPDARFAVGAELIGHIGGGLVNRPERLLVMLMAGRTPPLGRRMN